MNLHLGCRHKNIPGFVNIDSCDLPHIHYNTSLNNLSMINDNSVDLIYSCHILGYYDRFEVIPLLTEWKRVLKPKGVLRIAVPDFDQLIKVYNQTADLTKILGPLYGRMEIDLGNNCNQLIYERTVYNYSLLEDILHKVGFEDVHRYDWRKTFHSEYDDYSQAYFPHMDKENGLLISLNVEAIKK